MRGKDANDGGGSNYGSGGKCGFEVSNGHDIEGIGGADLSAAIDSTVGRVFLGVGGCGGH